MKVSTKWASGMEFATTLGEHSLTMDAKAPIGTNKGPSPKQLLLAAIAGCTAMDVVGYLRKKKQDTASLDVFCEGELVSGYPAIFKEILLTFEAVGNIDPALLNEAIELSQSKYCGVSAMVNSASPIRWRAMVNGGQVGEGRANFESPQANLVEV